MINQPIAGLDPNGRPIHLGTPDRPGVFLSRPAAACHLAELPEEERRRYRIVERGVRASNWNMSLWIAVPKAWEGAGS